MSVLRKPEWKDAPPWAEYLACDDGLIWHWYEEEPVYNWEHGAWKNGGYYEAAKHSIVDYSQTLERRP